MKSFKTYLAVLVVLLSLFSTALVGAQSVEDEFIIEAPKQQQTLGAPGTCDTGWEAPTVRYDIRQTIYSAPDMKSSTGKFLQPITAGWYEVRFVSWDNHTDHVDTQLNEQWVVEGYTSENVKTFTTPATADLPNDQNLLIGTITPLMWVPDTAYVIFKHAAYPDESTDPSSPNSIQPVCAEFMSVNGLDLAIDTHVKDNSSNFTESDDLASAPTFSKGDTTEWRVVLRNEGSWNGNNIAVSLEVPTCSEVISVVADRGTFAGTTWSVEQLLPGQSTQLHIITKNTCCGSTNTSLKATVSSAEGEDYDSPFSPTYREEGSFDNQDIAFIKVSSPCTTGTGVLGDSTSTPFVAPTATPQPQQTTAVLGASTQLANTGLPVIFVQVAAFAVVSGALLIGLLKPKKIAE